ncbi:MAG: hypothetical protein C0582_02100 [Alphaproteobacteria bacterium]|nr:MAG: hypothetical protein C0582_02100 [Alphaproteobacteria bacterium]
MNKQWITLFLITFSLSIIAMNPDVVPESRVPHWVNAGEKLFEKAEDFLSQTQEERSQTLVEYTKIIKSTLPPTQEQEEHPQFPTGCAKSVKSISSPTPHQLIDQALEHINSLSQEGLLSNTIVWSYFGYLAELGSEKPLRLSVWSQQTTLYCLPWAAESAQRLEKSFLNNLTLNFSYSEEEDKSAEVEQLHAAFDEGTYKPLLLFSPDPKKAKLGILPLLRAYAKGGAPVVLTPYDPSIQVHAGRFVGVSEIMNHDISHFYAFELIFGKGRSLAKGAEALSGWVETLTPAALSQKNIQQALIGAFFFTHEGFLDDFSHFPSQYLPEKIIDDFLGKNGPKKCLEAHCEGLCLMYWAAHDTTFQRVS